MGWDMEDDPDWDAEEKGCHYGSFDGGDPRRFTPDPECSTEAERAAWREDCASGTAQPPAGQFTGTVFVEIAMYGLGTNHAEPCTCGRS